jgi:hypothetical protein
LAAQPNSKDAVSIDILLVWSRHSTTTITDPFHGKDVSLPLEQIAIWKRTVAPYKHPDGNITGIACVRAIPAAGRSGTGQYFASCHQDCAKAPTARGDDDISSLLSAVVVIVVVS